ncbi:MAG TPA: helix-turn-helix domain-containing protein [Microlunatus sp.]|nr:helix-turn-helix domain-containing protein [Microlunatus sp.]
MSSPEVPPDEISLSELAARVRRLEEALTDPGRTGSRALESDPFWIIDGLEERFGSHAVAYAGSVSGAGPPVRWQMGHDSRQLLDLDWTTLAPTLGALGHPVRLRILQLIARGEAVTAADLADTSGLGSTGQIYHHLRQLVAAGWLRATTRGRHEVPPERLVPLLVVLGASSP